MSKNLFHHAVERSLLRTLIIVLSFCISLLFSPVLSTAVTLSGDSRTYLLSRESLDSTKILGAYEYLDLDVQNLGNETISFHTGGWLRYDLKGEELGRKTNNDLQYAYLSFKSKTDNAIVNLGRVMVFEGVAAERVDGIYARTDLVHDLGISAFAGAPVETEVETTGQVYGARLSHRMPGLYTLGLSFLKEEKSSNDFRKEEGIDLWLHPFNNVDIVGRSSYNSITKGWMENTYNLVLGPFNKFRFTTEASWIDYKDYFTGATSAAFFFRPDILDLNEKVRRIGEEVSYAVSERVNLAVDYKAFAYEIAGDAKYYGGTVKYNTGHGGGAGLSLHSMSGDTDRLKYMEYRVYGFKKIDKLDLALDILDVKYKTAINGISNAYSVSLAAQYDLTHQLKVGADAEYAKNPEFDKDVRVFAKVIYSFDTGGHGALHSASEAGTTKEGKP